MKIFITMFLSVLTYSGFAQKPAGFDARNLKVTWELVDNNYKNTGKSLSRLILANSGNTALSSSWVIYFNAGDPRNLNQKNPDLKIEMVNGDFFKLYPNKAFKGIAAHQSAVLEVISRPLKNITDYPKGFYIAFNANPAKGILLAQENKTQINNAVKEKVIAQQIFNKNTEIKDIATDQLPPVFPTPLSYKKTAGSFTVNKEVKIITDPLFNKEADYLTNELNKVLGVKLLIATSGAKQVIVLKKLLLPTAEAYELKITPDQIFISAAGNAGIFYGIQSLKTLLPADSWTAVKQTIELPGIEISDAPRFGHRAFMMDIARNYQPKKQVLKVLDLLSLYKMNVLHLHFNDDEGWRIEIPGLPELTDLGSKRGHTLSEKDHLIPAYGSGPAANISSGSGYLTKADFVEILKYATLRHITVIPEFETPGHARAAIKSMDARYARLMKAGKKKEAEQYLLRDINDKSTYRSVQGWNDNVINPALPSVYNFITKITDEMVVMYKEADAPLNTIHFGGDEVPAGVWEKSPAVTALLKNDSSVGSVDEVWHYYFEKVNNILKARQLYLSGWEEIGLKKEKVNGVKKMVLDQRPVKENYHTDVWNNLAPNEDLAYKLANAGYKVVLTNVTNLYMDLAYNKSDQESGQYWGGYVDIDKLYDFIPLDYYKNQKEDESGELLTPGYFSNKVRLTENGKKNIIGIQAPLWSEIITNSDQFEYLLLPKIFGIAERSWASDPAWATEQDSEKSQILHKELWSEFLNIIGKRELPRLNAYAGGFNYRIPTAGINEKNGEITANVQLPGFIIRYTTDGTEPTKTSPVYNSGLTNNNLSIRVFNTAGRGGQTLKISK